MHIYRTISSVVLCASNLFNPAELIPYNLRLSSGLFCYVVWQKFTTLSQTYAANIILKMEVASTSETSENIYQTTPRNNPEDSHTHTHCHENLKFQILNEYQPLQNCRNK
jgi:hypothetical protein